MSTNLLSSYLLISKRENRQVGNVVLYIFISRQNWLENVVEKQTANFYFKFLSETNLPTTPCSGQIKLKIGHLSFHVHIFLFVAETKVIQNHIARFSEI